jgi:hypothetical protein
VRLAGGGTPKPYQSILAGGRLRWIAGVLAALTAGPLSAQTVVPSPTRPRADSGRAGADTTRATPSDTTRRTTPSDTTRRATPSDTTRAVDSTARGAGDSVRVPAPAAPTAPATAAGPSPSPAPMDSVLAAACADGGYYLQVPNADLDPTVADRVIRYPTVQEVGPVSCPSP